MAKRNVVRGKIVGQSGGYIPVSKKPAPKPAAPAAKPKPKVPTKMGFNRKDFADFLDAEDAAARKSRKTGIY